MTNRDDKQSQDFIQTDLEIQTEKLRRITENMEDLQDRYTELYDFAPVGYIFMDEHGVILESNRTFATLMGTSRDSLISKTLACFILGEDQDVYHLFEKKLSETDEESGCELRMKTADFVSFWVCLKGKLYRDKKHGKLVRRIMVSDINKYRQTEEALIESEERFRIFLERLPGGVFAHDLNGRILFCNEQIKKALMDCQGRISSMASAHEMLYASDNLSLIDCQAYISKLTNDILRSYQTDLHRVKLTVDAEGITLGIQQASSLGLIINELLSNALKYGFPENMHGRIMIRLRMSEQNIMEFVFSDNGVGIPQDLDWRNTKSLGVNLIVLLTKNQLRGTVTLNAREGVCFTIRFKRETNQI